MQSFGAQNSSPFKKKKNSGSLIKKTSYMTVNSFMGKAMTIDAAKVGKFLY